MKKTAIGFLALLLVSALCVGCLMSCGKGEGEPLGEGVAKFTDVFRADPDLDIDNGYKTQKILSLPAEMSDTQEGGPFFAYLDVAAGNYCVYNVDLDKTVLTLPKADIANADDIVLYDEYISVVKTTAAGDESTSIYGEGGSLLATATGRETADTGKDGFLLAGMLYHVEDGVLKKTYKVPSLFTMSDVGAFTDDYLVYYTARGAAFYDQSFQVAALYEVPADVTYFDVSPLAGGKLFIRYEIPCDIASDDYDCFVDYGSEGQSKFDIYTGIFDPKTGETETLDLGNIAVSNIYNEYLSPYDTEFYDVFKEDVDNILAYYLIKDRRIDRTQVHCVLLDNDGNVGASLDQFVSGQRGLPSPMSESCYRVMTATGYTILDTTGNVLTSAPSVRSLQETDYGFIRIENSSVYVYAKDLSLALVIDGRDVSNLYSDYEGVLLYTKETENGTEYYRYSRAGEAKLAAPAGYELYEITTISAENGMYRLPIREPESYTMLYAYYNYDGELLFITGSMSVYAEGETAALVAYRNMSGERVYARLAR